MTRDDLPLPPHGRHARLAAELQQRAYCCRCCATPTEWATLSALGAMCRRCYDDWQREVPMKRPASPEFEGPKGWAVRLRWRERNGHALSKAQQAAWREVLPDAAEVAP